MPNNFRYPPLENLPRPGERARKSLMSEKARFSPGRELCFEVFDRAEVQAWRRRDARKLGEGRGEEVGRVGGWGSFCWSCCAAEGGREEVIPCFLLYALSYALLRVEDGRRAR
jgi:hypothetical protein